MESKKINIAGKAIPVFILALFVMGMTGLGYAAIMQSYGVISGTTTVEQSVLVDGEVIPASLSLTDEGQTHTLENQANVKTTVNFVTTHSALDTTGQPMSTEGMSTEYVGTVKLSQKNTNWQPITPMNERIIVHHTIVGDEFSAEVVHNEIEEYSLIYYADNDERFANPAEAILVENVVGNLPYNTDANRDDAGLYNYCVSDSYEMCNGAKIWYVPTDAIGPNNNLDWSRMDEFYFETELIQYNAEGEIILYSGHTLEFEIENMFSAMVAPGDYTTTTSINPLV